MEKTTKLLKAGKLPFSSQGAVNTPIHRTSTILFETLEDYIAAEKGKPIYSSHKISKSKDYSYSTTTNPSVITLQETIAEIDEADFCLVTPSGLSSITLTLFSLLRSGDHLLIPDSIYGPTRRFCLKELRKYNIETEFYDPLIGSNIQQHIKENTKVIFTESPGSMTFEIQDIPAISNAAKSHDITVVMDNSWSTGLYFKPFDHGVDICVQACTKYIGGHSDILMGAITAKDKYFERLFSTLRNTGNRASPDDCYLALRGIRTLDIRLKQHETSALEVANFLQSHPKVDQVLHPALSSFPGHELFKRDFLGSTGLFTARMKQKYSLEQICNFTNNLKVFGIGASWGGYDSLVMPFDPSSIRSLSDYQDWGSCIRFYIGLENISDIIEDISRGFEQHL